MKLASKTALYALILLNSTSPAVLAQSTEAASIDKSDPQLVFAYQGDAVLTQAALDGALSRIPPVYRLAFVRDGAKVDQLLKSLLQAEVLAQDAEKAGFASNPLVIERVRLAARKELAEAWMEEQDNLTPPADYAAMAYEDYLAHPEHYATEAKVDVSHILLGTKSRTSAEALKLATELRSRLDADPTLFAALVAEYSDDPSKTSNSGAFENVAHGQMVKPFEDAAYGLMTIGQISGPVESEFGYHLIRLDRRHESEVPPFETIRQEAETRMQAKHQASYRAHYLQKLMLEPIVFPEGAVDLMMRRYFGERLENAPIYTEDGIQFGTEDGSQ